MTNIPTELLRTLVAVVDLRSFTKAAQSLGVTQPAVSAQIKRLQGLLGTDLLDKSAPGVTLTSPAIWSSTTRDACCRSTTRFSTLPGRGWRRKTMRIGATGDFTAAGIAQGLTLLARRGDPICASSFTAPTSTCCCAICAKATPTSRSGCRPTGPAIDTRHYWTEPVVWVRSASTHIDPSRPVPLVSYGEECLFTRNAMPALSQAGRESELRSSARACWGLARRLLRALA